MRVLLVSAVLVLGGLSLPAQQIAPAEQAAPAGQATFDTRETRDPAQTQDEDFARAVKEWTTQPYFSSPLVDHLPKVQGIPSPKDVLGHHVGAPATLTYYTDILKYYRALEAATPRVKIENIGTSDEDRSSRPLPAMVRATWSSTSSEICRLASSAWAHSSRLRSIDRRMP